MLSVDECKRLKEAGWPEAADNDAWIVDRKTGKAYVWPTTGELIAAIENELTENQRYYISGDKVRASADITELRRVDGGYKLFIIHESLDKPIDSALADLYCKMKEADDGTD